MSSEWREVRLGEVATTLNGAGIKQECFAAEGIPLARVSNFAAGTIDLSDCIFVDRQHAERWVSHRIDFGDVVVATVGSWPPNWSSVVGKVVRAPASAVGALQNQNTCRVVARKGATEQRFLYYLLSTQEFIFFAANAAAGSANQARLGISSLEKFSFALPSLSEQQEISNFLGALDDRITLLRETNATLEAIAQALFKSWFVDFDPVRAKAEGRQPEGAIQGCMSAAEGRMPKAAMDATTAALFPDSFEESELGLVPKGWAVRSLDSIADYLNGLALQKFPPSEDSWLPVIKIAQLRKGDTVGADRAGRNIKPEYVIQNGDVLFSWSGSLEVVIWCGGEGALNQHLFKVTSAEFPKWFYYLWTRHHLPDFQQTAASKATTMGHIQRKHLTEAKVVVPSAEVLQEAGAFIAPLLDRWLSNAEQAQTLTQLRDTLLPRLISGQLRLPEAEALVAEAV